MSSQYIQHSILHSFRLLSRWLWPWKAC